MKTPLRVRQLPVVHLNRWYSIEEGLPFLELGAGTYGADVIWVTCVVRGALVSYPVCQVRWRHKRCDTTRTMSNRLIELHARQLAASKAGQGMLSTVPTPEEQSAIDLLRFTYSIPRAYNVEPEVYAVEPGRDGGVKSIRVENIVGWIIPSCPEKLIAKWLSANPEEENT